MAAPPRYRELGGLPGPPSGAPAIFIEKSSSQRFGGPPDIYSSSIAMSIPGSVDPRDAPPPPLPPPRHFPPDGGAPYPDEPRTFHRGPSSFSPRDSSHVGSIGSFMEEYSKRRENHNRFKTDRDEGYASLSSAGSIRSENSLPSFGQFHNRFQLESGADALADMKKKLDPLRTIDNKPSGMGRSLLSASVSDLGPGMENRLPALSLPSHPKRDISMLDSPDRFTQTPLHSAITPFSHHTFSGYGPGGYRSPASASDNERSPPNRTRRINSDDASTQGSYDMEDMEMEEASMNRLRIDEHATIGTKRRASSPPSDIPSGLSPLTSQGDMVRRRDVSSRGSPTPRLGPTSAGPTTSAAAARNRSFNLSLLTGNTLPIGPSSYGKLSPGGLSPSALSGGLSPVATDMSCSSPYSTPLSTNPSPRGSMSSRGPHQRNVSESRPFASPRKLTEVSKPNGAKMQGFFMCECCPKKPKKFETAEELNAHEQEKQYECAYCGNRFKNKNEAERHQNSLHVRRHSWSCSALKGFDRAFHESTNRPGEADTCGYCGEDFPRSGLGPGASAPRHVTDQNWEERIRHLQETHKFRECNSSKKFYRADHFRQHLKHSHAGTSGKWTNMLENACMLEEDPTPR